MDDRATLIARIEALETRIAHQDRMLEDLNATITAQWKEIDKHPPQMARLADPLQEVRARAAAAEGAEPPPPHY